MPRYIRNKRVINVCAPCGDEMGVHQSERPQQGYVVEIGRYDVITWLRMHNRVLHCIISAIQLERDGVFDKSVTLSSVQRAY